MPIVIVPRAIAKPARGVAPTGKARPEIAANVTGIGIATRARRAVKAATTAVETMAAVTMAAAIPAVETMVAVTMAAVTMAAVIRVVAIMAVTIPAVGTTGVAITGVVIRAATTADPFTGRQKGASRPPSVWRADRKVKTALAIRARAG